MSLPLPTAQLVGVFLELFSYGAYIMIFLQCMQLLQRRRSRPSDYLVGTAVSLFILVTAHLVIDIIRTLDAFTSNMRIPNYPIAYYNSFVTWQNISRNALYVTATVISDAFILYRTFIVWGRSYLIIVIPFILFLADIATGILWVYTITLVLPGETVFVTFLAERIKIFYGITLAMNIICTCLIACKIWKIQRTVAPFFKGQGNELSRLMAIIVESGSAYSAFLVAMIASYSQNSTAMFMLLNTMCPIIGIVFSSVIVRVGSGVSHGDTQNTGTHTSGTRTEWIIHPGRRQITSNQLLTPPVGSFPNHGIQIAMLETVHTHIDGFPAEEVETDVEVADAKSQALDVVDVVDVV